MQYWKSHRDQKVRPYVSKAIQEGCTILEIDLQQAMGKIVLGHNWRPKLPCLFDCTLRDYMDRLVSLNTTNTILIQLDIKEICLTGISKIRFAKDVVDVLLPYKNNFIFLPSANKGMGRPETMDVVYNVLLNEGFSVQRWVDWQARVGRENIITKDFW